MPTKRFFTGAYGADSIGLLELNEQGQVSHRKIGKQADASYLAYRPERQILYAITRGDQAGSCVCAYHFDGEALTVLGKGEQSAPGACHLDADENWLIVAYYRGGAADIFALDENGIPEPKPSFSIRHTGGGPKPQQDAAHIHWVHINESSRNSLNFYLIDLGNDSFCEYELCKDEQDGELHLKLKHILDFPAGSGPRHAYINKDKDKIYVLTELSSQLYYIEQQNEKYKIIDFYPLRGEKRQGDSWGGAIKADDAGSLLFCSNRGDETIRCFSIEGSPEAWDTGQSAYHHCRDLQYARVGEREFLLLAQLHSNGISVMEIDRSKRQLRELPGLLPLEGASCIRPAD